MLSFRKKNSCSKRIFSVLLGILMLFLTMAITKPAKVSAATPVYGQLKIVGNHLCDASRNPIQLKGMSSHGLQWYGQFMNSGSIQTLKNSWGANVVRAAMYTAEGGYISNPTTMMAKVKETIQAAIDYGIYVIVDWHILSDGNPNTYRAQSINFFQQIASAYGSYPNVIYEICNEPNGNVTRANDIKPYAQAVIPAIRAIDPDNIIICGTSTWSQDVDIAANSPLTYSNVAYTCHFYAGTYTQSLRDKISAAMSKGACIFVTEWGTSDASGNGGPYLTEAQTWMDFLAINKISWCNWSLCDKAETSAALKAGANPTGGWTDADLTTSGAFVKKNIGGSTPVTPTVTTSTFSVPAGTYASAQTVAIGCGTSSAAIRYTTDGSTPTTSSPIYNAPIAVPRTTTIKAMATKSGMTNSDVASATYTISSTPTQIGIVVTYTITSSWGNCATVNVTIKNNGTAPINGWTLVWTFPGNQTITNIWSATYTRSGATITARNLNYNESIPANGGTQNFGFNISFSGTNAWPTSFTLNGIACQVQ